MRDDKRGYPIGGLYILARVMKKARALQFVKGEMYLSSLTEFGAWEAVKNHDRPELNNSFRGDLREGSIKNVARAEDDEIFNTFPEEMKKAIKGGAILDVGDIQYFNTLCLCRIDFLPEFNMFIPPSPKMKDFGDTAVIIRDMNEFLRRFMIGLEKYHPYVLLMDKVEYYSQGETRRLNPLFNKPDSYCDQNELRIAVGCLDMNKPTSNGKHELRQSTEPLRFDIGDISDITQMMTIDDFCTLSNMDSVVFPMIDMRSNIFNMLIEDTKKRMRRFESRKQTIIFSI